MNLTNFLGQIDALIAQYGTEQFISFIHDIGRVLPEHSREDFLRRLKAAGGKTEKKLLKDMEELDFHERHELVRNNLGMIESQEAVITGIYNEEYDDWYSSGDDEFFYQDNDGVSEMLAEACDFVHTCMDAERYREGFEIGGQLFSMKILCENEYGDEDFTIHDMVYHELLHRDLTRVCLDAAYCAYHAVSMEGRPEALYGIFVNARKKEVTLEKVMQHGDEGLPDFREFLAVWIAYLGTKMESNGDRLILEAIGLLDDVPVAVGYAKKYADVHPGLYFHILENGEYADAKRMASIGLEAMKHIPKKYTARGRVALKTAECLLAAKESQSSVEECYFAAYESDICALNYLRALFHGYGDEKKRGKLQRVLARFPENADGGSYYAYGRGGSYSEREVNKPDNNTVLLLRFLEGQFADVLEEGLNKSEALGWSGTFMKQGIALYLLYLQEGPWSGKGIHAMASAVKSAMNFSAEEYGKGIHGWECPDEDELFRELFLRWKSMTQMDDEMRGCAIKRIEGLLEKRTEGIMGANRRNYYGECASYIAALGEVRESMGELGAKQNLMTSYKEKYSRRNAFRGEMKAYGWVDVKKK